MHRLYMLVRPLATGDYSGFYARSHPERWMTLTDPYVNTADGSLREGRIRIIMAREVTPRERRQYESGDEPGTR
jgi:hypothetical protein